MKIISDKLLQNKIDFFPHAEQQKVLDAYNSGKMEIVVSAGMQSGKSILCSYIILKELLSDNKSIAIIAPSYDLGLRIFDQLKKWLLAFSPDNPPKFQTKPFPRVEFHWGSFVEVKSAEAVEGMLGKGFNLIVVDEASRINREVFQQYILPRISSKKGGKVLIISTPLKKGDWFFEEFMANRNSEKGASFQFPSTANPYFDQSTLEIMRAKLPKVIFDREFLASFTEGSSSIFTTARDCISGGLPREAITGHRHLIGLDLAQAEDFTACSVIDESTRELVYVDRWNKLPYPIQKQKILVIANNYSPCRIIIDGRNIGAYMSAELKKEGLNVKDFIATGNNSKDPMNKGTKQKSVEKAMSFFESKDIAIPNDPILLDEIESYSYLLSPHGNIQYGVASGLHDDMITSLILAMWDLQTGRSNELLEDEKVRTRIIRTQRKIQRNSYR